VENIEITAADCGAIILNQRVREGTAFCFVRGKLILQLHGNEFFHRTVSSFCVVRYGLLSLHGKHFFISGGKQIFIAAVRTFFLCSK